MPEPAHDALEALRARLAETRVQAERLADEVGAARAARAAGEDPGSSGTAGDGGGPAGGPPTDLQAVVALLESLRDLVPPELQQQLAELTRQILLLLRALIDLWVDRLDGAPDRGEAPGAAADGPTSPDPAGPTSEDIPVT